MDFERIEQAQAAGLWHVKQSHIKEVDESEHTIWIDVLRLSVDRDGEVVLPQSPIKHLKSYLDNPVVLHGHNYRDPAVAKMVDYQATEQAFTAKDQFAVEEYDLAATLFKLYAGGYMSACSVGFIPKTMSRKKKFKDQTGVTYTEIEMLEHSLVTIPSNRESLRRNYQQFKSWDPRLKDNIDRIIEAPTYYDCGHPIIVDEAGNYAAECSECAEQKHGLLQADFDDYGDSGNLVRVAGKTEVVNGHWHTFSFSLDNLGKVAGMTRGLRVEADDSGEFTLDDLYIRPELHTHLINDARKTLEIEGHSHGIVIQMDAFRAAAFAQKTAEEISREFDVAFIQTDDEIQLVESVTTSATSATSAVASISTTDGQIFWVKLPSPHTRPPGFRAGLPEKEGAVDPPAAAPSATVKRVTRFADLPTAPESTSWHFNTTDSNAVLGDPPDWSRYRRAHVWYDPENKESKAGYKLPVARMFDGTLNVVWRGVAAAMGALLGARGGVDIPDDERRPAYNHLVKYYKKFDKEPPEFKEYDPDEIEQLIFDEPTEKAGRVLSQRNFDRIQSAVQALQKVLDESSEPEEGNDKDVTQSDDDVQDQVDDVLKDMDDEIAQMVQRVMNSMADRPSETEPDTDFPWQRLRESLDRLKSLT